MVGMAALLPGGGMGSQQVTAVGAEKAEHGTLPSGTANQLAAANQFAAWTTVHGFPAGGNMAAYVAGYTQMAYARSQQQLEAQQKQFNANVASQYQVDKRQQVGPYNNIAATIGARYNLATRTAGGLGNVIAAPARKIVDAGKPKTVMKTAIQPLMKPVAPASASTTSGPPKFYGVTRNGKKWKASAMAKYLGTFQTREEAARRVDSCLEEHNVDPKYRNFQANGTPSPESILWILRRTRGWWKKHLEDDGMSSVAGTCLGRPIMTHKESSRFYGVSRTGSKCWKATCLSKYLGTFPTEVAAARTVDSYLAKRGYSAEFRNFRPNGEESHPYTIELMRISKGRYGLMTLNMVPNVVGAGTTTGAPTPPTMFQGATAPGVMIQPPPVGPPKQHPNRYGHHFNPHASANVDPPKEHPNRYGHPFDAHANLPPPMVNIPPPPISLPNSIAMGAHVAPERKADAVPFPQIGGAPPAIKKTPCERRSTRTRRRSTRSGGRKNKKSAVVMKKKEPRPMLRRTATEEMESSSGDERVKN